MTDSPTAKHQPIFLFPNHHKMLHWKASNIPMETAEERLKKWTAIAEKQKQQELVEDLILQNKTLDALIKGLTGDIEIFKNDKEGRWTPADIVRFTLQLNVMRDKKVRNLSAINEIIKKQQQETA